MKSKNAILFYVIAMIVAISSLPLYALADVHGLLDLSGINRRRYGMPDNYFSLTLSGGYTNTITHDKIVKPLGFMGATVGLGYEMHVENKSFWWSVNGELQCMTSALEMNRQAGTQLISADENLLAGTPQYDISKWGDYPHYLFVSLPVMFGYFDDDFYVGVGPKLMLCVYGRSINNLYYSVSGNEFKSSGNAVLKNNLFNAAACFEIGGILSDIQHRGRRRNAHGSDALFKLGFYAEYGFLNMNASSGDRAVVSVAKEDNQTLSVIPIFTSSSIQNRKVNPFYAGLKLTFLFNAN